MLIAFTGAAGSGKDTAAAILAEKFGFIRTAFADPLKAAARIKFGLSEWHTNTQEGKRTFMPEWGMDVRALLQMEGSDATKPIFGEDFWVKRWLMTYSELTYLGHENVTVSDLRFPVEGEEILNRGGYIVRLVRPHHENGLTDVQSRHSSETPLDSSYVDFQIINDGSLLDLEHKVLKVFRAILAEESGHGS